MDRTYLLSIFFISVALFTYPETISTHQRWLRTLEFCFITTNVLRPQARCRSLHSVFVQFVQLFPRHYPFSSFSIFFVTYNINYRNVHAYVREISGFNKVSLHKANLILIANRSTCSLKQTLI